MDYFGRVPAPPLDRYVDDVYCLTGEPRHRRLNVPPMPSAHLMINLAAPARLVDSDASVPPASLTDAWFMGLWTRRFLIEHQPPVRIVGVHFKPWGLSPFLDIPSVDLRNRWVPAAALWGRSVDRMRDRITTATTTGEVLQVVEDELRSQLVAGPSRGLDLVHHTAGHLAASWGTLPIGSLSEDAGVSANHLAAQYKTHLGVTPKRVARIYRFARLILSVDARRPVDWSDLAQTAGYFDQSHFSREFKDFTGHTPSAYLALRRRFPAERGFPPDNGPMPAE